jgi:hypothetical protein
MGWRFGWFSVSRFARPKARCAVLTIMPKRIERGEPVHLLVDSTGVRVFGEGE